MQTSQKNLDSNFEYLLQLLSTAQNLFEQRDYFSAFQYLSVNVFIVIFYPVSFLEK